MGKFENAQQNGAGFKAPRNATMLPNAPQPPKHLDYLLTAYLFENISAAGKIEVESHLAHCPECRDQLELLRCTLSMAESALDDGGREYVFEEQRKKRVLEAAKNARHGILFGIGGGSFRGFQKFQKWSWKVGAVAAILMVGAVGLAFWSLTRSTHSNFITEKMLAQNQRAEYKYVTAPATTGSADSYRRLESKSDDYVKSFRPMTPTAEGAPVVNNYDGGIAANKVQFDPAVKTPPAKLAQSNSPTTGTIESAAPTGGTLTLSNATTAPKTPPPSKYPEGINLAGGTESIYRTFKGQLLETPGTDPQSKESASIEVPRDIMAKSELGDHFETKDGKPGGFTQRFGFGGGGGAGGGGGDGKNGDTPVDFAAIQGNLNAPGGAGGGSSAKLEDMLGAGAAPGSGGGWGGGNRPNNGTDAGAGRGGFGRPGGGGGGSGGSGIVRHGGAKDSGVVQATPPAEPWDKGKRGYMDGAVPYTRDAERKDVAIAAKDDSIRQEIQALDQSLQKPRDAKAGDLSRQLAEQNAAGNKRLDDLAGKINVNSGDQLGDQMDSRVKGINSQSAEMLSVLGAHEQTKAMITDLNGNANKTIVVESASAAPSGPASGSGSTAKLAAGSDCRGGGRGAHGGDHHSPPRTIGKRCF